MKSYKPITSLKISAITCDGCGVAAKEDSDFEFQEYISIVHRCGYGSIHGDNNQIEIDLCQQCFADMCGDSLRIDGENVISKATEGNESCTTRSAVMDILSKKIIDNKAELTIALKRVEQLWGAQYQSAEGSEFHQLTGLISTYEKKDWDSFFEQEPLADDDFMPGRLNFKSKFSFDDDQTASGILSKICINNNVDDEASRDSAITGNNYDETNNHLLESIVRAQAKHPELRLGQLLVNAMKLQGECSEIFYIENADLAEKINLLSSSLRHTRAANR